MVGEGQDTSEDWTAIVVGLVCGVVVCAVILVFFWCYQRDMQKPTEGQADEEAGVEMQNGPETTRELTDKKEVNEVVANTGHVKQAHRSGDVSVI